MGEHGFRRRAATAIPLAVMAMLMCTWASEIRQDLKLMTTILFSPSPIGFTIWLLFDKNKERKRKRWVISALGAATPFVGHITVAQYAAEVLEDNIERKKKNDQQTGSPRL